MVVYSFLSLCGSAKYFSCFPFSCLDRILFWKIYCFPDKKKDLQPLGDTITAMLSAILLETVSMLLYLSASRTQIYEHLGFMLIFCYALHDF